jgi:hypothetical protein
MIEALALKLLFASYYLPDDPMGEQHAEFASRISLTCTPFSAGDREVDGWVVCAIGTPPKGTLIIFGGGSRKLAAYHIYAGSRQIDLGSQMEIVEAFHEKHLRGREEPLTIP